MPQILETKGGSFSVMDALAVAGLKIASEQMLSRVRLVGNASVKSGIIKGVMAVALSPLGKRSGMLGKLAGYEATALMVDAGEDLVGSLLGKYLGRNASNSTGNNNEIGTSNQGAGVVSVI